MHISLSPAGWCSIEASASQPVDLGSILLSNHTNHFKNGIHKSPLRDSAIGVMLRVKYEIEFTRS